MVRRECIRDSYLALGFAPRTDQVSFLDVPPAADEQKAEKADWNGSESFYMNQEM